MAIELNQIEEIKDQNSCMWQIITVNAAWLVVYLDCEKLFHT